MNNQAENKNTEASDPLFVLGLDAGKPRGARFAKCTDVAVFAAAKMGLSLIHPASAAFAELAQKLPKGRVYASGKAFVPNIRRDLYDKLLAVTQMPGDGKDLGGAPPGARTARRRLPPGSEFWRDPVRT